MIAYISVSFSKRRMIEKELKAIDETLSSYNIRSLVFVDKYKFDATQEREMMNEAMKEIDNCEILIAEVSDKAIGIGIEAGYAKAKNKPVIYLRHKNAEHSTTVSGISDFQIVYNDEDDLKKQLTEALSAIKDLNISQSRSLSVQSPLS